MKSLITLITVTGATLMMFAPVILFLMMILCDLNTVEMICSGAALIASLFSIAALFFASRLGYNPK